MSNTEPPIIIDEAREFTAEDWRRAVSAADLMNIRHIPTGKYTYDIYLGEKCIGNGISLPPHTDNTLVKWLKHDE